MNPVDSEKQIHRANMQRIDQQKSSIQCFIPFQFLKRRKAHTLPGDDDQGQEQIANPQGRHAVSENNAARSALRRYIFLWASEPEMVSFLNEEWNRNHYNRIHIYRDRDRKLVYVPQKIMLAFMKTLADIELNFELTPTLTDLRKGEPVRFRNNAFEGRVLYVIDSRRTSKGNVVTVAFDLVKDSLQIKVYDVHDEDIIHLDDAFTKYAKNNDLIKRNQNLLLPILSRRINHKEDDKSRLQDAHTLDNIFVTRFRHFDEAEKASYRRFLAQILVCACLRHDDESVSTYTRLVLTELEAIDHHGESKAATDVRARIHAALFLATGEPKYRGMARDYVRDHNPKSEPLKTLVRLISKRKARESV